MKRLFIIAALILSMLMPATTLAVSWTDLINGNDQTTGGITISKNKGTTVISGNTDKPELHNVLISNWEEKAVQNQNNQPVLFESGKYVFRNVTLTGSFKVISIEAKGQGLEIELDDTVIDRTTGISLDAGILSGKPGNRVIKYRGKIDMDIHCDTQGINIGAANQSHVNLLNTGDTVYLSAEANENGHITIENRGKIVGSDERIASLMVQAHTNSTIDAQSLSKHTQTIYAWATNNSTTKLNNYKGSIDLVNLQALKQSNVQFTCDGTITNQIADDGDAWGNCAVMLEVDENSKLFMEGTGTIKPGTQLYDYYLGKENGKLSGNGIPGPSVICDIEYISRDRQSYADCIDMVKRIAKNIELDWNRIEAHKDVPHPVLAVRRDERAFIYPLYPKNIHFPVLINEEELQEQRTTEAQILIGTMPNQNTDLYLKVENYTARNGSILYELELVNERDDKQDVLLHTKDGKNAVIYLPYPSGMSLEEAHTREFVIRHDTGNGIDIYSTSDGTAQRHKNGLMIEVNSLSPFEIIWNVDIPGTGDSSNIRLYVMALMVSAAAIGFIQKRKLAS